MQLNSRGDTEKQEKEKKKKTEPEGGVGFSFHYCPESIWLKIKAAGLWSASDEDRTGWVSHQMQPKLSNLHLFMWKSSCHLPNGEESVLYSVGASHSVAVCCQWNPGAKTNVCSVMDRSAAQTAQTNVRIMCRCRHSYPHKGNTNIWTPLTVMRVSVSLSIFARKLIAHLIITWH